MIVVVGGGITGLAIGWELDRAGKDVLVLESTERAGGVIRSAEVDGRILDWGPQRTRMTPSLAGLVDALGLTDEVETARSDLDLFVFRAGRLRKVPLTLSALAGSDIVGLGAKLRFLLEPFTGPARESERVATCFRRKIGNELYETLVGPLFGGLYGSDPADMEVGVALADVLRRLGIRRSLFYAMVRRGPGRPLSAPCSFRGGMQALPDAFARALSDRFRLCTPVRSVVRARSGWRVEIEGGEPPIDAEQVVLATPARATARILAEADPASAAAIRRLRYNSLALVHLDAMTELDGLGFQVSLNERNSLLRGVTFNTNLFPRPNLYTAFLGGSQHPEVATMSADELSGAAVDGFRRTTGYQAAPLAAKSTQMPAWDMSWRALDGLAPPDGLHLAGNWRSRPGLPGRLAEARRVAAAVA